ncbi:thioredoxin family protein [Listeria grandensis]|uniref:Thioredoxin family protein n=1 Tax=Listeria grandensis TaxID=1494963 RepID=A0A7X0Y6H8_9LIST|nr:thioredoxin family protein [Listeria grandensis]MBC1475668.1 thioredoxin family protein [Listeria grandensis]MBC1937444.1 thioredoxin family protein [Listeria grandensis]
MVDIWNKQQLLAQLDDRADFAVYFFTPMCLGCQQAMKLVDLAGAALPDLTIGKMDLNYVPELAEKWAITNVPVLLIFKDGAWISTSYRLGNMIEVYDFLKAL